MNVQKSVPTTVPSDVDKSYYAKFLQEQTKIRNLATADPNSYAAVVVKSMDHFTMAQVMMKEHFSNPHDASCIEKILKEFSSSYCSSELFGLWTPELRRNLTDMANDTLKGQGCKTSDLDRYARICSVMIMSLNVPGEAIKFVDVCRKKYPNEVFFHQIYCDLFLYKEDFDSGLKASDEVAKLFPNNTNILHSRAGWLKMTTDTRQPEYRNWAPQKKQIELVKEAYKNYLKVAPKDHRQFAKSNHVIAYLSLKYSTPSSQISDSDLQEISLHFRNGIKAELDILPCFLPFTSEAKQSVAKYIDVHPTTHVYQDGTGTSCTVDLTTHTENITFVGMRKSKKGRIDVCVPHRQLLKNLLSDPVFAILTQLDDDQNMKSPIQPGKNDSDNFQEIVLNQMKFTRMSEVFTSKVIQLTVAEDSLYSVTSGFFEMVVADTTRDAIKLQLDLGTKSPENHILKMLMKKFRFGTVWSLRNPDFRIINEEENIIRATPECLIRCDEGQNGRKCRICFKLLTPGEHCSKCKRASYCGFECQIQDWKYIKHNFICSEVYNNLYN